jgi:hypothetical protein
LKNFAINLMLKISPPTYGLVFFSFLYRRDLHAPDKLCSWVENLWGPSIKFIPQYNPLLNYYAQEMGEIDHLERFFLVPHRPLPREMLLSSKLLALEWERKNALNLRRQINVDVGFIHLENFILSTTKNYSHRIYIGQGIFAELTYEYTKGTYHPLPWCYPDYRDQEKITFISSTRKLLL